MFGLLNLNKPAGITSRSVVDSVHRLLPRTSKVGHAGTLDPMATGVLVVCVGTATRLVPYVQELTKSYRAGFRLGCRSDTDDVTGSIVETVDARVPGREEIEHALQAFRGTIVQTPPQYSALRVGGKRAYDLARTGVAVELVPREVEISHLELVRCDGLEMEVDIDCSSGTYIRSIARDLGESLGIGGLMTSLVRTAIGPFRVEAARSVESLTAETLRDALLPAELSIGDRPRLNVTDSQATAIRQGVKLVFPSSNPSHPAVVAVDPAGRLVGFGEYEAETGRFHPRNVFHETSAT
ncbi:tRNA pseudouridine synthase B [Caulifigura coniformis]|uniref:tRNA pseudouridine synthase B n=1 Tax=Caulifigura coniformis TaxID=2527983 RepID=A0A517SM93_9PLAN|nr:tRNA pseudouridine(55) synthase TruB [Caulifigura coniformis]QDT57242.1 tRNA pseudouridine synthase B [Caulifigura coniformis]